MRIILIGNMGAGKDEAAKYLQREYKFYPLAFADKVKEVARELFPEEFTTDKPRILLQSVGEKMREIKKDCWTNYVMRQVRKFPRKSNLVITDCRYLNEMYIAQENEFIPVRIACDWNNRKDRLLLRDGKVPEKAFAHASETEMNDISVPFEIQNNGTLEDFHRLIDWTIKDIRRLENENY